MAHKTLTVSEEAYDALARLKTQNESFTEVILRLSKEKEVGTLSQYVEKIEADDELALNIETSAK